MVWFTNQVDNIYQDLGVAMENLDDKLEEMKQRDKGVKEYFDSKGEIVSEISKRSMEDYLVETVDGKYFIIDILEDGEIVEKNSVQGKTSK